MATNRRNWKQIQKHWPKLSSLRIWEAWFQVMKIMKKDVISRIAKCMGVFQIWRNMWQVKMPALKNASIQLDNNKNNHICKWYQVDDSGNNQEKQCIPAEVPEKNSKGNIYRENMRHVACSFLRLARFIGAGSRIHHFIGFPSRMGF